MGKKKATVPPKTPQELNLFEKQFLRDFASIKASLHSLQLRCVEGQPFSPFEKSRKKLQAEFAAVDVAFAALNNAARKPQQELSTAEEKALDEALEFFK